MSYADSSYHSGSWSFPSWWSRPRRSSSWRWGLVEWPDSRRLLQIPDLRRNLTPDCSLQPRSYNSIIVAGNISGGTALNPLAVQAGAVALVSPTFVIRLDILHDSSLTRNQLEVHQLRNQSEINLEHRGACFPLRPLRLHNQVT